MHSIDTCQSLRPSLTPESLAGILRAGDVTALVQYHDICQSGVWGTLFGPKHCDYLWGGAQSAFVGGLLFDIFSHFVFSKQETPLAILARAIFVSPFVNQSDSLQKIMRPFTKDLDPEPLPPIELHVAFFSCLMDHLDEKPGLVTPDEIYATILFSCPDIVFPNVPKSPRHDFFARFHAFIERHVPFEDAKRLFIQRHVGGIDINWNAVAQFLQVYGQNGYAFMRDLVQSVQALLNTVNDARFNNFYYLMLHPTAHEKLEFCALLENPATRSLSPRAFVQAVRNAKPAD